MPGRIVEIAQDDQYLSVSRGFLVVSRRGTESARVPLDDIGALIGNAHGLSFSSNVIAQLALRGVPTVFCSANHRPSAVVWPLEAHFEQAGRIGKQIATDLPTRKRLWKQIVARKLQEQARLLQAHGKPFKVVERLARGVLSGDRGNREARGARHYWRLLFGKDFRRDPDSDGINSLLNYGYAVLRATVARAIVAVGLHPSIGLFHRSGENAFQLVDDLMEPYRPSIDAVVVALSTRGQSAVSPQTKRALALAMYRDRRTIGGLTPLSRCIENSALSLVTCLQGDSSSELEFPDLPDTDDLKTVGNEEPENDELVGVSTNVDHRDV